MPPAQPPPSAPPVLPPTPVPAVALPALEDESASQTGAESAAVSVGGVIAMSILLPLLCLVCCLLGLVRLIAKVSPGGQG